MKCITSEALRCGSHSFYTANTPHLPSPCKRSPDGATHLITAYYSFMDPERMKRCDDLVSWPRADGLPIWLPVSCRLDAGQGKSAGQRPTFFHWATPPTILVLNWDLISRQAWSSYGHWQYWTSFQLLMHIAHRRYIVGTTIHCSQLALSYILGL